MRTVDAATRAKLQSSAMADVLLAFLTIEHENLATPIRVVNDVIDYTLDGDLYQNVLFGFNLMPDGPDNPSIDLVVPNIDKRIGAALRPVSGRAKVSLEVYMSSDFNLSVDPRVPLGTPTLIYGWTRFELVEIDSNRMQVKGKLILRDMSQEQWPGLSATQSRCPGAFR